MWHLLLNAIPQLAGRSVGPPSTSQFGDIIKLPMYACFDRWVNIVSILFPSSSIGGHLVNVFYSYAHCDAKIKQFWSYKIRKTCVNYGVFLNFGSKTPIIVLAKVKFSEKAENL